MSLTHVLRVLKKLKPVRMYLQTMVIMDGDTSHCLMTLTAILFLFVTFPLVTLCHILFTPECSLKDST